MLISGNKISLSARQKKSIFELSCCPKKKFWTKQETIPPRCKLNGRSLSDHFITFCTRKSQKEKVDKLSIARIRSTENYNKEVFNDKLNAID